jgi:hypothetical protein
LSTESGNITREQEEEIKRKIRVSRIVWPVFIGIGVLLYLSWRQFDIEEFNKIKWTTHTLVWVLISLGILITRHLAYSYRLYVLSDKEFGWRKCIELIFIWEFSSAVSPTNLGGSAVAFLVLSQEKLSTAKTATIVIYTIVLDTAFFVLTIPILYALLGPEMIRPGIDTLAESDNWGFLFVLFYVLMAIYGSLFYYALLVSPLQIKRLIVGFTKIKFLRKFRHKAIELGDELIISSGELSKKHWRYHAAAFLSTAVAWSSRFLLLSALIIAIVRFPPLEFWPQLNLYGRLQSMFVIMAFSPTPGGSGFAEFVFGGFLSDYVPKGIALVVAVMWRLLAYYTYLLAGLFVIPNWLNKILAKRREGGV